MQAKNIWSGRLDLNQQNRGFKPQMSAVASRPECWRKVEDLNPCGGYAVAGSQNRSLACLGQPSVAEGARFELADLAASCIQSRCLKPLVPSLRKLAERARVELATVLPAHALQACRLPFAHLSEFGGESRIEPTTQSRSALAVRRLKPLGHLSKSWCP